jgi:hypothetical protein
LIFFSTGFPGLPLHFAKIPSWPRREADESRQGGTREDLRKGSSKKFGIYPLTLPSPARGEGKYIEIIKKFPPP